MAEKQVFIIGTGRNGSKLLADLLTIGSNITKFGEILPNGPYPDMYKAVWLGFISQDYFKEVWFKAREDRMSDCGKIYLEKNHLIVPVLDMVNECYPESMFIYIKRDYEKVFRSFISRGTYYDKKLDNYERGRLSPRSDDKLYYKWNSISREEKVRWLINTYSRLCEEFVSFLDMDRYRVINYEEFSVVDNHVIANLYDWIGIDGYNPRWVNDVLSIQKGTSTDEGITGKLPDGRKRE